MAAGTDANFTDLRSGGGQVAFRELRPHLQPARPGVQEYALPALQFMDGNLAVA
jgi:hypothetical protein